MSKLIFYCSGGLGNRLNPMLNVKDIFKNDLYIVWPQTKRLMCDFHDIFENENIKILDFSELVGLTDVDNYHGTRGGLIASQHEYSINLNNSLLKVSKKYLPKPIGRFNPYNISHENTIVFYNTFIGEADKEIVKDNFFKLKPKKEILDKIDEVVSELNIDKNTIGIHARGTDFIDERVNQYFPIIEKELSDGNEVFFCSDDPDWESIVRSKYPNVKVRSVKNNVHKIYKSSDWLDSNIMTPLEAIKDGYVDMILLSKTNFKHFNNKSSFGKLINLIQ